MAYERIGPPMKAHEIMALKAALGVLRRCAHPGVVQVLETVVRDEEAKRRRVKAQTPAPRGPDKPHWFGLPHGFTDTDR